MIGRHRNLRVGGMRYRVTIQSPAVATSVGVPNVSWSDTLTNEPADYEYVRGGQSARGRQVEEGVDAVFTVRYRPGYTPKQRVVFESENYGIVFVRPVGGRNRYLELHVKVVK